MIEKLGDWEPKYQSAGSILCLSKSRKLGMKAILNKWGERLIFRSCSGKLTFFFLATKASLREMRQLCLVILSVYVPKYKKKSLVDLSFVWCLCNGGDWQETFWQETMLRRLTLLPAGGPCDFLYWCAKSEFDSNVYVYIYLLTYVCIYVSIDVPNNIYCIYVSKYTYIICVTTVCILSICIYIYYLYFIYMHI